MRTHPQSNPSAQLAAILERLRVVETHPLRNASLSSGRIRVLNEAGAAVAALGHIDGKSGLLVPSGGSWVTVGEFVQQRVFELAQAVDARVAAVESSVDTLSSHVGSLGSRMSAAEGTLESHNAFIGDLGERTTGLQTAVNTINQHIGSIGTRLSSVEGTASSALSTASTALSTAQGRVSQAQLNAVIDYMTAVANAFNSHMDTYHSGGGKVPNNPPVKG